MDWAGSVYWHVSPPRNEVAGRPLAAIVGRGADHGLKVAIQANAYTVLARTSTRRPSRNPETRGAAEMTSSKLRSVLSDLRKDGRFDEAIDATLAALGSAQFTIVRGNLVRTEKLRHIYYRRVEMSRDTGHYVLGVVGLVAVLDETKDVAWRLTAISNAAGAGGAVFTSPDDNARACLWSP